MQQQKCVFLYARISNYNEGPTLSSKSRPSFSFFPGILPQLTFCSIRTEGTVYVTDMDQIEKSNLSRQFLFRNSDISKPKSTTSVRAVAQMNSEMQVGASQLVVWCIVLYCTVLYCIVLYCTVLYCTVLYCTVLYCTVLYCTIY